MFDTIIVTVEGCNDEDENMNLENYENLENPSENKNKKISENNQQKEEILVKEEPEDGLKGKNKGLYSENIMLSESSLFKYEIFFVQICQIYKWKNLDIVCTFVV